MPAASPRGGGECCAEAICFPLGWLGGMDGGGEKSGGGEAKARRRSHSCLSLEAWISTDKSLRLMLHQSWPKYQVQYEHLYGSRAIYLGLLTHTVPVHKLTT